MAQSVKREDFLDTYKSLSSNTDRDYHLLTTLTANDIEPESIRYSVINGPSVIFRGVVKSTNQDLLFFHINNENVKILPPENTEKQKELQNWLNKGTLGFDLRKSLTTEEESEEDDTEKASALMEVAGTSQVPEKQVLAAPNVQTHPSASIGTTPDLDSRGKEWHKSDMGVDLLRSFGQKLKETAPISPKPTSLEQQFIEENLGKSINYKTVKITPQLRQQFFQWKEEKLKKDLSYLSKWVNKNK